MGSCATDRCHTSTEDRDGHARLGNVARAVFAGRPKVEPRLDVATVRPVDPAVTLPGREHALCPNSKGEPTVVLLNSGSLASYAVQPTWEVGYNALANRLGMSMPLTRELIMRYRSPPSGWVGATHHMAWETLTHGAL